MKKTTQPSPVWSCRRFRPQPHRTVIIFATNLHRRSRKLSLLSLSLSFPLTNQSREHDLWSTNQSHHHHLLQTHPPISPLSDPPTNLWSFTSLFLSIYLSLSLSHDRCLFLRKTEYFLLCFFVDLVYIFRFHIIIFVWKKRKYERMCFLEDFQKHNQIP